MNFVKLCCSFLSRLWWHQINNSLGSSGKYFLLDSNCYGVRCHWVVIFVQKHNCIRSNMNRDLYLDVYTILKRIKLTIWTICAFRVLNPQSCFTGNKRYPLFQLTYYAILMFIIVANIVVTAGMYTPIACVIFRHSRNHRIKNRVASVQDFEMCCREMTLNIKQSVCISRRRISRKNESFNFLISRKRFLKHRIRLG